MMMEVDEILLPSTFNGTGLLQCHDDEPRIDESREKLNFFWLSQIFD